MLAIQYLLHKDQIHKRNDPRYVAYVESKHKADKIKKFIINELPYLITELIAGIATFIAAFGLQIFLRLF